MPSYTRVDRSPPQRTPDDSRLRHLAAHVHSLGPYPLYWFLRELEAGADLQTQLDAYARLDPHVVAALGGSAMPPHARLIGGRS
jgi:hypothetical protein